MGQRQDEPLRKNCSWRELRSYTKGACFCRRLFNAKIPGSGRIREFHLYEDIVVEYGKCSKRETVVAEDREVAVLHDVLQPFYSEVRGGECRHEAECIRQGECSDFRIVHDVAG